MSLASMCLSISGPLLPCALLIIPNVSLAADLPQGEPFFHERTILAESHAKTKLSYWQNRLNLKDWSISVAVVRSTELRPNTLGSIHWEAVDKTAKVLVMNPADYHMPLRDILYDLEVTVVHELVHLKRARASKRFWRKQASRSDEERAVNRVTESLLKQELGH
jgi:hypothetical protein